MPGIAFSTAGDQYDLRTVTALPITATNATPGTIDAARPPLALPQVPLVVGEPAVFSFPASGALQVGPFTAGGGAVTLAVSTFTVMFNLKNAQGQDIVHPLEFVCKVPKATE